MSKKKILFIILPILIVLAAAYWMFIYEYDADRVSPLVPLKSYAQRLDDAVRSRVGKSLSECSADERSGVLFEIARDPNPVLRVTAMRLLGTMAGTPNVDAFIVAALSDTLPAFVEEAIGAIAGKKITTADAELVSLVQRLATRPDAMVPLTDIGECAITGSMKNGDVVFDVHEQQQSRAPFDVDRVREINLFIPANPVYYLSFPNFDDRWREFVGSRFVERFVTQPAYGDLAQFKPLEDYFHFKAIIDEKLGALSKQFTPDRLFRDDLKFARYRSGRLIVTFAGKNIGVGLALMKTLESMGGKYALASSTIEGTTIRTIRSRGGSKSLSFAEAGDYLIMSDSPSLIEKSIRTFKSDRFSSITADPVFQSAYERFSAPDENRFLFAFARPTTALDVKGGQSVWRYVMKKALGALSSLRDTEVTVETIVPQSQASNDGCDVLRFIPRESIGYLLSRSFRADDFLSYVSMARLTTQSALDSLQLGSGVLIARDLVPHFGRGGFISYSGIKYGVESERNLSAMQFVVGLRSTNASTLEQPLTRLFTFLFREQLRSEMYNGAKIFASQSSETYRKDTTEAEALRDLPISPAFALVDSVVLIGMNPAIVKDHIDTYRGARAPLAVGSESMHVGQLLSIRSKPFLTNFYSFVARYARRTMQFSDREVEERVKPLFDVLAMNRSVHGWFKELQTIFHGQVTLDLHGDGR